jgi:hypothetical protein
LITILSVFYALTSIGCSPNQRIINSSVERSRESPTDQKTDTAASSFEQDIESMETADFIFIYVFRRKDGSPLDGDDKRFASQTIPPEMNRRTVSDNGKAIIIGSNFRMPDDDLTALSERFAFEDFSRKNEGNVEPRPVR